MASCSGGAGGGDRSGPSREDLPNNEENGQQIVAAQQGPSDWNLLFVCSLFSESRMAELGAMDWMLNMWRTQVDFYLFAVAEELGVILEEVEEVQGNQERVLIRSYAVYFSRIEALEARRASEVSIGVSPGSMDHYYDCREMYYWTRAGGRVNLLRLEADGNFRLLDRSGDEVVLFRQAADASLQQRILVAHM